MIGKPWATTWEQFPTRPYLRSVPPAGQVGESATSRSYGFRGWHLPGGIHQSEDKHYNFPMAAPSKAGTLKIDNDSFFR
jgi:hypothetical protein